MARSSLFTIGNQNQPRLFYRTHKVIQTLAGYTITYKGEELRQDDEDVFLQLVHLARNHVLGEKVEFTAFSFLTELGWKRSVEGYNRLKATLDRLQGTGLRISSDGGNDAGFQGALVRAFMWRDSSDAPLARWQVFLEPQIIKLFGKNEYTHVFWDQRLRLRSSIAKYLHGYYASHEFPYPISVQRLKGLTGSSVTRLTDFRKSLRRGLDQLVTEGFLDKWNIDAGDLVHVVRKPKPRRVQAEREAA